MELKGIKMKKYFIYQDANNYLNDNYITIMNDLTEEEMLLMESQCDYIIVEFKSMIQENAVRYELRK